MPSPKSQLDPKALYAQFLVHHRILEELKAIKPEDLPESLKIHPGDKIPKRPGNSKPEKPASLLKICIVGAGAAGIYAARMLDKAGIKYDLFEASHRAGGRILTYHFPKPKESAEEGEKPKDAEELTPHDYYDIGAMRFPQTPIMKRLFDLFMELGVPLKEYYMSSVDEYGYESSPSRYNDITKVLSTKEEEALVTKIDDYDPFEVAEKNGGPVPNNTVLNANALLSDAYEIYRQKIKRDPESGFKYLMCHDTFSLRDYLNNVEGLDYESIHWLETLNSATGWFDLAFSENVMEDLAFDWGKAGYPSNPDKPVKIDWKCVDGGTEVLIQKMLKKWGIKVNYKTPVIYVGQHRVHADGKDSTTSTDSANDKEKTTSKETEYTDSASGKPMKPITDSLEVKYVVNPDNPESRQIVTAHYDAVINSTTLAALQKIDLTDLDLSYATKTAIRSLHYDTSTKVAIKFKEAWWMKDPYNIRGGLGKTDMPLRVCVYPSYNVDDDKDKSTVLLCSYTWGQDSERIASMVTHESPKNEEQLKTIMLQNLAHLHAYNGRTYEQVLEHITALYETHHAFDWSADPYSAGGAFALFGPGQFSKLYPHIIRPSADSRFHIVGEHASCHHAWVIGALDSAQRGVHMVLERFGLVKEQKAIETLFKACGEIDYETTYVQSEIGRMDPRKQPKLRL